MKKILLLVLAILAIQTSSMADEKPIAVNDLPTKAQEFINQHFTNKKVAYLTLDQDLGDKDYNVMFQDGSKVEFDKKGQWTQVECKTPAVPTAIIPTKIQDHINALGGKQKIIKIEKNRLGYDVETSSGFDMKFNTKGEFVRHDD